MDAPTSGQYSSASVQRVTESDSMRDALDRKPAFSVSKKQKGTG
jgi:hypothetical protein